MNERSGIMVYVKWTFGIAVLLLVVLFLHYTLPGRDIVQIVGTDVKRMDIDSSSFFWDAPDAGTNKEATRDVRFINAVWPDGSSRVYRNEDTDWGWPPYFKFNSGDLTAKAQSLAKQDDVWVAVTHYGWRIKLFTIFPNAVSISSVPGPDTFLIPWFNIIFFILLAILIFFLFRAIRAFKQRNIDPVLENIDDMIDGADAGAEQAKLKAEEARRGAKSFLKRWFGEAK